MIRSAGPQWITVPPILNLKPCHVRESPGAVQANRSEWAGPEPAIRLAAPPPGPDLVRARALWRPASLHSEGSSKVE